MSDTVKIREIRAEIVAVRVYLEQKTKKTVKVKILVKYKIEVPGQGMDWYGYDFYDAIVDTVDAANKIKK